MVKLTAEAILVTPVSLGPDLVVTPQNVRSLRPSPEIIRKASGKLTQLGFHVEAEGAVSITISGNRDLFERIFDLEFTEKAQNILGQKGSAVNYLVPKRRPKLPEDFAGLVQDVVFPEPPTFF